MRCTKLNPLPVIWKEVLVTCRGRGVSGYLKLGRVRLMASTITLKPQHWDGIQRPDHGGGLIQEGQTLRDVRVLKVQR